MGLIMALTDKPPGVTKRGTCGVERLGLSEAEQDILELWLDNHTYSDQAVSDRLAEEGHDASHQILRRHRTKRCSCFR